MGLKLGYENIEGGMKLNMIYTDKNYGSRISNLLKIPIVKKDLGVEFYYSKSDLFNKIGVNFDNIFFFPILRSIWGLDVECASKTKNLKLVNFEISPILKLKFTNQDIPLIISLKYCNLEGSKSQSFTQQEYSSILQSLFPYQRFDFSLKYSIINTWYPYRNELNIINDNKISFSKLLDFEDAIRLSSKVKFLHKIPLFDYFSFALSNEIIFKKSFILNNRFSENPQHGLNHIISLYDCHSKLLNSNIRHCEKVIENSSDLVLQNVFYLRFKDFFFFRKYDLLSRIEPYMGVETIFSPNVGMLNDRKAIMNSLHCFLSFGLSFRVYQNIALNFSLKTIALTENCKLSKDSIGKFRINLDVDI